MPGLNFLVGAAGLREKNFERVSINYVQKFNIYIYIYITHDKKVDMFLSIMICSILIFIFFKSKQLFSVKTANLIEKTPFFQSGNPKFVF
jgi:hypothetical protein